MEIWLKQGNEKLRLPVLPSNYSFSQANKNTTADIVNFGEVTIIGQKALASTSISAFFPNKNYSFVSYKGFPKPKNCVNLIKSWMDNPVRLIITGTNVNMLMTIESFNFSEQDATGDIYYNLELKEYRIPKLTVPVKSTVNNKSSKIETTQSTRETKLVKTMTVTVKAGDTLMGIAKKVTGNAANYKAIMNQNKITNPKNLRPGQKLVIKV